MHEWALPEGDDPKDMVAVKATNPFSGITVETLAQKFASPTMTMHHWMRFVCDRPQNDSDAWLGPNGKPIWDALEEPYDFEDGAPTWVGVDVGIKRDSTAVVAVQKDDRGHLHARCRLWVPTEQDPVDITDVMEHLRDLDRTYSLRAVSFDPTVL